MKMKTSKIQKIHLFGFLLFLVVYSVSGCAQKNEVEIKGVTISSVNLRQGDEFILSVKVDATRRYNNVTASFQIKDGLDRVVAKLESDFLTLYPSTGKNIQLSFRWADLHRQRVGKMRITHASLKQYTGNKNIQTLSSFNPGVDFHIVPAIDEVQRMFVSRENSLWWLSEMGRVDNNMTRRNGLSGCTMFGGIVESWIRNDNLVSEGTDGLCYWEITGYTVRQFALEYERSGNRRYLEMAQQSANSIIRYVQDDKKNPLFKGSLPTFLHFDGRPAGWYRGKAVLFDHGQVLMGLLELVRVMKKSGHTAIDLKPYQNTAKKIGAFMLRARDHNKGKLPSYLEHKTLKASSGLEETSKGVIGFNFLYKLTGDKKIPQVAKEQLNHIRDTSKPYRGEDHHGRSYNAYGFIRGFEDYQDQSYLRRAEQWLEQVALDMNDKGLLQPKGDYSAIPAQNQLIRNASLLWKLTADPRYLEWAGRSAQYLTRSSEPWTYRQPVLKLGRFYREAGGIFNNISSNEVCSWASIFHIDAMYHYLSLTYGHVYVGNEQIISMIGSVKEKQIANGVELSFSGSPDENIGVYVARQTPISSVEVDGKQFPYYSAKTARLPLVKGLKHVRIMFGQKKSSHITQTNSSVLKAELNKSSFNITLKGKTKTKGVIQVHWTDQRPAVFLDGKEVVKSEWSWDSASKSLVINYPHNGKEQTLKVMSIH